MRYAWGGLHATESFDLRSVQRLRVKLVDNRRRLVRSLANKFDGATLASLYDR
jgi:hypothetical protein